MLTAADLTPIQRKVLGQEHRAVGGFCPGCLAKIATPVMWWAHLDLTHPASSVREKVAWALELVA